MQTRILLLAALSLANVAADAQNQLRVDPDVQRQRDQTRITILQDELVSEALALSEVQKLLRADGVRSDPRAAQESSRRVARHRQNISALAKELALTERQVTGSTTAAAPAPAEKTAGEPLPLAQILPPTTARESAPSERRPSAGRMPEWVIPGSRNGRTP